MSAKFGPRYWRLKDAAKVRGNGLCEFCAQRSAQDLHHRWYTSSAYTGLEGLECVMAVCRICHKFIHRRVKQVSVAVGSLGHLRDTGFGNGKAWREYLKRSERK